MGRTALDVEVTHAFRNPRVLYCGAAHEDWDPDGEGSVTKRIIVGGKVCKYVAEGSKLLYAAKPCEHCLRAFMPPKWKHHCESCCYFGQADSDDGQVDIYWCASSQRPSLSSVIGRFGDEPNAYASHHPPEACAGPGEYLMKHALRWYLYALAIAARRGLWTPTQEEP
jgi:hypothetical protein